MFQSPKQRIAAILAERKRTMPNSVAPVPMDANKIVQSVTPQAVNKIPGFGQFGKIKSKFGKF